MSCLIINFFAVKEMIGFKQILVAIDQSPQASAVFNRALDLAQKLGANLVVFHCFSRSLEDAPTYTDLYGHPLTYFSESQREDLRREIQQVQERLQDYCQQAIDRGISTEIDGGVGAPGPLICEKAKDWQADLIVVGHRGRTGLSEALLGSASNYVVHHTPCSVLVVQGKD